MTFKKENIGFILLAVTAIIAVIMLFSKNSIPQSTEYHNFCDNRLLFSIPNFWNVISNIPFIIVGCLGLHKLKKQGLLIIDSNNKTSYTILFIGIIMIGFGSSYYHLNPNNYTLLWDRLPMAVTFMALFTIIITEFTSIKNKRALLFILLLAGISSVLYWYITELFNCGDLRFYFLVQFYPMIAIPIILICFSSNFTKQYAYWLLLIAYIIAKLCEHFDHNIYNSIHFISGHSIKHIMSAIGLCMVLKAYEKRTLAL